VSLLTPPFLLGAAGQVLSGRLGRLALGSVFRPAATGVQIISGVLAGPANTQGELSLAGNLVTVQAFRAVIQSALDATAGSYEVINDAAYTFPALTAQHATQYRRSLVVVRVDDSQVSGVASSAATDRATLEILDGALAASSAATVLPAPAGSWLALGEVLIPPTGQAVTLTPYNPRTGLRHGILPVIADGSTVTGHDGAPGLNVGQVRDHPTYGQQRWDGARWGSIDPIGIWLDDVFSTTYSAAVGGFANPPSMGSRNVNVPPGRQLEVQLTVSQVQTAASTNMTIGIYQQSAITDYANFSTGSAGFYVPMKLSGVWTNTTNADVSCNYSVAAALTSGTASLVAAGGVVRLSRRLN
jgi:hypothetical protein